MQIRKEALWACFAMEPQHEALITVSCGFRLSLNRLEWNGPRLFSFQFVTYTTNISGGYPSIRLHRMCVSLCRNLLKSFLGRRKSLMHLHLHGMLLLKLHIQSAGEIHLNDIFLLSFFSFVSPTTVQSLLMRGMGTSTQLYYLILQKKNNAGRQRD